MGAENDLAMTIMNERLVAGVKMVRELAVKHELAFTEAMFIQGCQAGISMFIQKEQARRFQK